MKLFMLLLFVVVSAGVTLALCPSLRVRAQEALVEAELIPAEGPGTETADGPPASGEATLKSVWHGAKERAARAVGREPAGDNASEKAVVPDEATATAAEPAA
jgi:hypothetical protein